MPVWEVRLHHRMVGGGRAEIEPCILRNLHYQDLSALRYFGFFLGCRRLDSQIPDKLFPSSMLVIARILTPLKQLKSAHAVLQPYTAKMLSTPSLSGKAKQTFPANLFFICSTRAARSYSGLQPPQYLTPTLNIEPKSFFNPAKLLCGPLFLW